MRVRSTLKGKIADLTKRDFTCYLSSAKNKVRSVLGNFKINRCGGLYKCKLNNEIFGYRNQFDAVYRLENKMCNYEARSYYAVPILRCGSALSWPLGYDFVLIT